MIGLDTLTYDLNGSIVFDDGIVSDHPTLSRRVTRTATLDSLSVLSDLGFTDSDGTFDISIAELSANKIATLEHMIKNYSRLRLSSSKGCFIGVLKTLDTNRFPIKGLFLIEQKVSL